MSIEKRYQERVDLEFDAQLVYRRRGFPVRIKNLSTEGIFLETGVLTIPTGTLVDMEFDLAEHSWQISGLVVHRAPEGIGVMFRMDQPELFSLAREVRKFESTCAAPRRSLVATRGVPAGA
jgi:hypothetical protein